ncbi:glycoside hydrolase family 5 protein [Nibricoccus sp. IMCC34717]|uniref:glycoside hydrolase family 5 protein n=1 Tax=Nibricoccus sp. IMCC34717 TaxID=3034021 RepID=UPI00384C528A
MKRPSLPFFCFFPFLRFFCFLCFFPSLSPSLRALPWLDVRGQQLVADDKPVTLRGFNLGNWLLLEDFLFGLYGTDTQMRRALHDALGQRAEIFWEAYESAYFTDADASRLRELGVNLLRVPLNQNRFEDPNRPGVYSPSALAQLDRVIALCRAHGIYVLIDLHAVPGGQSRQIYADSTSAENEFWRFADCRARATDFWGFLATRFANESAVAGYDLINEPETEGRTDLLTDWHRTTLKRIRSVDTRHLVWLEGDDYGKRFDGLTPDLLEQERVLVQFHIYPDLVMPVDKLPAYPGEVEGTRYDLEFLRRHLAEHIAYSKTRPLLLGEFGIFVAGEKVALQQRINEDFLALAREYGWSWSIWTYKDHRFMGLVHPRADTPWRRFLVSAASEAARANAAGFVNDHHSEAESLIASAAKRVSDGLRWHEDWHTTLSAKRAFSGLLSKVIARQLTALSDDELRALARSFALENCETNEPILSLYQRGLGD